MIAPYVLAGLLLAPVSVQPQIEPIQPLVPRSLALAPSEAPVAARASADSAGGREVEPLRLDLGEALAAAMQYNPAVQGALLDAEAAWAGFGASWGAFDASFFTTLTKSETIRAPAPNNFVGGIDVGASPSTESDVLTWRTGLRGQFETGTQWEFGVGPTWVRTQTEGFPRADIFTAAASLSLTQPLLRGGSDDYAKSAVELAVQDANIAAVDSERVAAETLEAVITAYWNLVFTVRDVATRELSVQLSQELRGITQRKYDQGLQNRLDVVAVEAELARRLEEQLTAVQGRERAMDDLRRLILSPDAELWNRPIVALTDWNGAIENIEARLGSRALDVDAAMLVALGRRPDVRRARMALERADIELRRAGTDALPRLDVTGSYGINSNETSQTDALRLLNSTAFHEARLFVDFELPFGNRQAGYTERRRLLERERALVSVRETEVAALSDVRDALRQVELQTERVRSAAETTRLQREVYEGERRRLENDLSTPYQVREFQRDLLGALDTETRAQLDLAVAWTRLVAAQGLLVSQSGYELPLLEASVDEAPPAP